MSSTFEKLKKNTKRTALIFALAVGLSCGLFASGLFVFIFKICELECPVLYAVLIGVGLFVLGGGVTFLLLCKSEKRLAKALDEEYRLRERVQTMVDFKNENTDMVKLQRADTEEKLKIHTQGKRRPKRLWAIATTLALAAATFVTAVAFPANSKPDDKPSQEPFAITQWQLTAMKNLIDYVDRSEISTVPRDSVAVELESLLAAVCSVSESGDITTLLTEEGTSVRVKESIVYVDELIEGYNTYKVLYNTIRLSELETVKAFAVGVANLDVTKKFVELRAFFVDEENADAETVRTALAAFATQLSGGFLTAEVATTDELLVQTIELTDSLAAIAQDTESSYAIAQGRIDSAFTLAESRLNAALAQQNSNREGVNYVISELIKIFEIKDPPATGGEQLAGVEGSQNEEDVDTPGGPPELDGPKYGSNDEIYYPDEEKYVVYGEIYKKYSAKKEEISNDQGTDDELKDLIDDYFDYLRGTMDTETEEN